MARFKSPLINKLKLHAVCGAMLAALIIGLQFPVRRPLPLPAASNQSEINHMPDIYPSNFPSITSQPLRIERDSIEDNKSAGVALDDTILNMDTKTTALYLRDMHNMGFETLRFNFSWNDVQQKSSTQYDWGKYDRFVQVANQYGFTLLGTINYTPLWARQAACNQTAKCFPQDLAAYSRFVNKLVSRYGSQHIHYWEIWNEENSSLYFKPQPNAEEYTAMLKLAYTSIKQVDPSSKIILGGLDASDDSDIKIDATTFLSQIYSFGARNYFDAVGYHPYTYPLSPENQKSSWQKIDNASINLIAVMTANNDIKKVWITEYGAPTNGPVTSNPVSESTQQSYAISAFNLLKSDDNIGPLYWYSYKDLGTDPSTKENFFGLIRADGSHKPAYDTWKQLLAQPRTTPAE